MITRSKSGRLPRPKHGCSPRSRKSGQLRRRLPRKRRRTSDSSPAALPRSGRSRSPRGSPRPDFRVYRARWFEQMRPYASRLISSDPIARRRISIYVWCCSIAERIIDYGSALRLSALAGVAGFDGVRQWRRGRVRFRPARFANIRRGHRSIWHWRRALAGRPLQSGSAVRRTRFIGIGSRI
jgi:hypothetical protein